VLVDGPGAYDDITICILAYKEPHIAEHLWAACMKPSHEDGSLRDQRASVRHDASPSLPLGQFLEVFLIIFQSLEEERFRDNITLEIGGIYVTLRLLRSEVSKTVLLS
jgi:hypothetical protein